MNCKASTIQFNIITSVDVLSLEFPVDDCALEKKSLILLQQIRLPRRDQDDEVCRCHSSTTSSKMNRNILNYIVRLSG
jgi:hypothetical protein